MRSKKTLDRHRRPNADPAVAAFDVVNRLTGTTPPKTKATPKKKRRPGSKRK